MKKVLFSATVDSHILHFHLPYLKMFKEKGYEVHVATNTDDTIPFCDIKHKVCFERSPFKKNNLKAIKQMEKILLDNNFDIVHTHTPMGSVVTRLAYKKVRNKVNTRMIYTAHGFHFYKGAPLLNWLLFYPVEKYLSKYTDTLITINKEDFELAKTRFNKRCFDIQYLPGIGVDDKKFNREMTLKEKNDYRKSIGIKEKDFVIIYPARLCKDKNQKLLLDFMIKNKEKNDVKLLLPGKDEYNGFYQKYVEEKNIKNVLFLGQRDDIYKLLNISNLLIASSIREGFGINLVEALACEIPVIAVDNRGHREIIEEGINGYIINNDVNDLYNTFLSIYNNKTLYMQLLNNSKKSVEKFFLYNSLEIMKGIYFNNKDKRVLQIFYSLNYGGAENFIMNIYRNIDRDKVQFDFLLHHKNGVYEDEIKKMGGKIFYLNGYINEIGVRNYRNELKAFFSANRYDVIHCHLDKTSGFIINEIKKIYNPICIAHSHCCGEYNNFIVKIYKKYLKHLVIKKADYKFACSEEAGKWLFNNNFKIVNNPIDIPKYSFDPVVRNKLRKKYKINDKDIVIGTVGRLEKVKNQLFLIDVFEYYQKKHKNSKLFILGSGNMKDELEKTVNDKGLSDMVIFQEAVSDAYNYYNVFDIFALTSLSEGLGIVLLEATANSLPIISTSNIPDNLYKNNNIQIVKNYNVLEWLTMLESIKPIRKENKDFLNEYDVNTISSLMEEEYLKLLENKRGE